MEANMYGNLAVDFRKLRHYKKIKPKFFKNLLSRAQLELQMIWCFDTYLQSAQIKCVCHGQKYLGWTIKNVIMYTRRKRIT